MWLNLQLARSLGVSEDGVDGADEDDIEDGDDGEDWNAGKGTDVNRESRKTGVDSWVDRNRDERGR